MVITEDIFIRFSFFFFLGVLVGGKNVSLGLHFIGRGLALCVLLFGVVICQI